MNPELPIAFLLAALALSVERLSYAFAWHRPADFRTLCSRMGLADDPVTGLERLFYAFKLIQFGVFTAWILAFDALQPRPAPEPVVWIVGGLLMAVGQTLNFGAIWRLGRVGIFYGVRFGHAVAWCEKFPFSMVRHPQYVGTVLSIWGLFLVSRFPGNDWMVIPVLETVYYSVGSMFEKERPLESGAPETTSEPA